MKYILCFCLYLTQLYAVGEAGAIFLLIAPGAGPQGTGEAQVAKVNDAYASYYNPAGLGFLRGKEAAGMHVNWLPNLASDLYYEFITYRQYVNGLGSIGGHLIYLNLGEQVGMDEFGNPTDNWKSYMGAAAVSFGTQLSKTSSIGFNFKVFHQKLSDQVVAGEEGKGYSTDFGFDIGYLKKFRKSNKKILSDKIKKTEKIFKQLSEINNMQKEVNEKLEFELDNSREFIFLIEDQELILSDIEKLIASTKLFNNITSYSSYLNGLESINSDINNLIDFLDKINNLDEDDFFTYDTLKENSINTMDKILLEFLNIEKLHTDVLDEIKLFKGIEEQDRFNFGFSISNIGPKIDFVDVDQADPSPTNMRIGIFKQFNIDEFNKINFLFDANKLLVTRYQMMDWDGDGLVGGYNEFGTMENGGNFNIEGRQEYDSKGYIDDPWYVAIFTAWLDDWYLGGDIDYAVNGINDQRIGGYACEGGEVVIKSLDTYECESGSWVSTFDVDFNDSEYGIYGKPDADGRVKKEKGSKDDRSFSKELEEMIYNVGLEYWYTDAFALRVGYIYDYEGKVFNPTFGAGLRFLQYGFDFGYTHGEQGHPRANTMFFSINMEL